MDIFSKLMTGCILSVCKCMDVSNYSIVNVDGKKLFILSDSLNQGDNIEYKFNKDRVKRFKPTKNSPFINLLVADHIRTLSFKQ